jgi:hypothetical protein
MRFYHGRSAHGCHVPTVRKRLTSTAYRSQPPSATHPCRSSQALTACLVASAARPSSTHPCCTSRQRSMSRAQQRFAARRADPLPKRLHRIYPIRTVVPQSVTPMRWRHDFLLRGAAPIRPEACRFVSDQSGRRGSPSTPQAGSSSTDCSGLCRWRSCNRSDARWVTCCLGCACR